MSLNKQRLGQIICSQSLLVSPCTVHKYATYSDRQWLTTLSDVVGSKWISNESVWFNRLLLTLVLALFCWIAYKLPTTAVFRQRFKYTMTCLSRRQSLRSHTAWFTTHFFFVCVSFHYVWSRESILYSKGYLQRRKKEYSWVQGKVIFGLRSLYLAAWLSLAEYFSGIDTENCQITTLNVLFV